MPTRLLLANVPIFSSAVPQWYLVSASLAGRASCFALGFILPLAQTERLHKKWKTFETLHFVVRMSSTSQSSPAELVNTTDMKMSPESKKRKMRQQLIDEMV